MTTIIDKTKATAKRIIAAETDIATHIEHYDAVSTNYRDLCVLAELDALPEELDSNGTIDTEMCLIKLMHCILNVQKPVETKAAAHELLDQLETLS